jgi:hypothetical protein
MVPELGFQFSLVLFRRQAALAIADQTVQHGLGDSQSGGHFFVRQQPLAAKLFEPRRQVVRLLNAGDALSMEGLASAAAQAALVQNGGGFRVRVFVKEAVDFPDHLFRGASSVEHRT